MADNTYEIIIKYGGSGGDGGGNDNNVPKPPQANNPDAPTLNPQAFDKIANSNYAKSLATLHTAMNLGKQIAATQVSYVEITTAHHEQARRTQWAMNTSTQILDTVGGITVGALAAGPFGAMIAGAKMIGGKLMNLAQQQAVISAQRQVENNQIALMNVRAGTSGNRKNTFE